MIVDIKLATNHALYKVWNIWVNDQYRGSVRHNLEVPDVFDFSLLRFDLHTEIVEIVKNKCIDQLMTEAIEKEFLS